MLRPLADRILVKPLSPTPASDLIALPENASRTLPTTGDVVAVGQGNARLKAQMVAALTTLADSVAHLQPADVADVGCGAVRKGDVLALLDRLQARLSVPADVAVGQRVVFAGYAATDLTVDGEDYITVREDDIQAILED